MKLSTIEFIYDSFIGEWVVYDSSNDDVIFVGEYAHALVAYAQAQEHEMQENLK